MTITSDSISSKKIIKKLMFCLFVFVSIFCLNAEILIDNEFGYYLDIPEGYQIQQSEDNGKSYLFYHQNIPVNLAIKIYSEAQYNNSMQVMKTALSKLSVTQTEENTSSITWNDRSCTVSNFTMLLDKAYYTWAVCVPCDVKNSYLYLMCYTPCDMKEITEQFIISTINSLYMSEKYKNTAGIISSLAFKNTKEVSGVEKLNGKEFNFTIGDQDLEGNKFITDLEYSVLYLYKEHKAGIEAWKRFYRQIYKDSYERLKNFSEAFYKTYYPQAKLNNPQNPDIAYAQIVLDYVHTLQYKRNQGKNETDFTSMIEILYGVGNDCDSRSMMVCILLNYAGIDSIMLISPAYSHAMAGVNNNAPGQKYTLQENGKTYLYGETTDNVTWGMLPQNYSDESQWIPIVFD